MRTIRFLLLAAGLVCALDAHSQNANLGTSGAQFLKLPIGARAAGMAGAYVGLADDASAMFWNPAGIVNIKGNSVHFSHMRWFESFDVNAASWVSNLGRAGFLGVGVLVFQMDPMEVTTERSPEGTGLYFDAMDVAISVAYARRLTDAFNVGLTAKYVRQQIWNESANGLAFDVGTQYRLPFKKFTIAMTMSNFGPDLKMGGPDLNVKYDADSYLPNRLVPTLLETESFPLPLNFEFGISMDVIDSRFFDVKAGVDAVHPNDNDERIQVGSEVSFFDRLFLRGGYKYKSDDEVFSFGVGFNAFVAGTLLHADYAFTSYDLLPNVNRVSFGIDF